MRNHSGNEIKSTPTLKIFFKLLNVVRQYSKWLVFALVISMINSLLTAQQAVYMANIANNIVDSGVFFSKELYFYLFIAVILIPFSAISTWLNGQYGLKSAKTISDRMAAQIVDIKIDVLDQKQQGEFVSKLMVDVAGVKELLQQRIFQFLSSNIIKVSCFVIVCFIISWQLMLVAFVVLALVIYVNVFLAKPMFKRYKDVREANDRVIELAGDAISSIDSVKSYTLENRMSEKYSELVDRHIRKQNHSSFYSSLLYIVSSFVGMLPLGVVAIVGGFLALAGIIHIGNLLSFVITFNSIYYLIVNYGNDLGKLQQSLLQAERILEIFTLEQEDVKVDLVEAENLYLTEYEYAVEFNDIQFAYPGKSMLYHSFNIKIRPGEKVIIVGESGCGKTSLFQILLGFYAPHSGRISVFGRELDEWNLSLLRSRFAVVTQDVYLFPCSIAENILYGNPDASEELLEETITLAGLRSLVDKLPQGKHTLVGERGVRLSGGEQQRISIARALIKDAPIVLLDEPTSALDFATEHALQEELDRLLEGRTAIVITHRLTSVKNTDRILCMADGHIVEEGTHNELMARQGEYYKLYHKQQQKAG